MGRMRPKGELRPQARIEACKVPLRTTAPKGDAALSAQLSPFSFQTMLCAPRAGAGRLKRSCGEDRDVYKRQLENRMTVRKEIPRLGKHRKEPDFGTIVPKLRGACLVAASCVSFASARWRKLTRSAAAPLPTKSDDFAGAPVGNTPQEWGRKPFRGERQRKAKWRERMSCLLYTSRV